MRIESKNEASTVGFVEVDSGQRIKDEKSARKIKGKLSQRDEREST
jgi:hypothetical protein